jgi:hypothetical protein
MESVCNALINEPPKNNINQVISNNKNLQSNNGQLQDENSNQE